MKNLLLIISFMFLVSGCSTLPQLIEKPVYIDRPVEVKVPVRCEVPEIDKPIKGINDAETLLNYIEYTKILEKSLDTCKK